MSTGYRRKEQRESGVATLIEYILVTSVLLLLFMVMLLQVNSIFMQGPAERLEYTAFTDVGNGISTRIVDVYSIVPTNGSISTTFDIPDDVAEQDYYVIIGTGDDAVDQDVMVYRGLIVSNTSLSGIGATRAVTGNTTGRGINKIRYNSQGF